MSKKAKTSAPIGEVEPERAPEGISRNTDVMDDSSPQGENTEANLPEADPVTHIDPSSPHATPPSPTADPRARMQIRQVQPGVPSIRQVHQEMMMTML